MHTEYWLAYLMRNDRLEDLDIDGRVILKRRRRRVYTGSMWHGRWTCVGCCEINSLMAVWVSRRTCLQGVSKLMRTVRTVKLHYFKVFRTKYSRI
jgi:hypothetical protein